MAFCKLVAHRDAVSLNNPLSKESTSVLFSREVGATTAINFCYNAGGRVARSRDSKSVSLSVVN